MKLKSFGLTDIGLNRPNNEDVWIEVPDIGLYAIADGMGGHQAGEVAAKEAIETLAHSLRHIENQSPVEMIIELKCAIEKANKWVHKLSKKKEGLCGMGTTLCCLIWTEKAVIYGHVGDSRIYRVREKKLELLTEDHSLYAKWQRMGKKSHTPYPYKNVITKAIGTHPETDPEISLSTYQPTDLFLLCTDGLTDVLSMKDIEKIINQSKSLKIAGENLIHAAKNKGSSDNITLLLIEVIGQSEKNLSRQQRIYPIGPKSLKGND